MNKLPLLAVILAGCATPTKDVLKSIESGAYDAAAESVSQYCKRLSRIDILDQERLEARREIRQRGSDGPVGPGPGVLDDKTAYGRGPVIRIWCDGESVPASVWEDFIR